MFAAYWDLATGVLAMLALLTVRIRPLFWLFVVAFNLVGTADLISRLLSRYPGRASCAGRAIRRRIRDPVIYVPLLMITHFAAFYLLVRRKPQTDALAGFTGLTPTSRSVVG